MERITRYRPVLILILCIGLACSTSAQTEQISFARVELMPNAPSPYLLRDWRQVAMQYDAFVYDSTKKGQYLPLINITDKGINYPGNQTFGLHSYVGTMNPNAGEAINVLPSLVGATLSGVDKSNQFDKNWVLMSQDYYGKGNGELIYVNNRGGGSGNDWWYDLMPNIYFYQLYDLYGSVGDAAFQFENISAQFARAVRAMGGSETPWSRASMGYRAWDFVTMQPNDVGVPEPEAAGAYAWVLYNAYKQLNDPELLKTAEWSMEYLVNLGSNPSYELQLPYGAYIAAKMNAEINTEYNIEKLVFWVFNRGPLRGWGTITGNWGGLDVSGLVGEANDQGNDYAFQMNGVQHAAALVPMVRYDKRFTRAIGKWVLNLANATRFMFPGFLPAAQQDASDWTDTYDPDRVMGYESMREQAGGFSPFATGDAVGGGWAETNLALYGTSSIGYLGGMIEETDQSKILKIDLLKTDFLRDPAYPSYLLYNPYPDDREVLVSVGSELTDVYDAVTETFLESGVTGDVAITVPADDVRSLVYVPAGSTLTYDDNRFLANGVIIDYMQNAVAYNVAPRIQALAAKTSEVMFGDTITIYAAAIDPETKDLTYIWSASGGTIIGEGEEIGWIAPQEEQSYEITLFVFDDDTNSDTAQITIDVAAEVNIAPDILRLSLDMPHVESGATVTASCVATDQNGDSLTYSWTATDGEIDGSTDVIEWTAPQNDGIHEIRVTVSDNLGGSATQAKKILVYGFEMSEGNLIAHYPFDGDALDVSGNMLHGQTSGAKPTTDRFGNPSSAYFFDGINDHISVAHDPILNFADGITVSCWAMPLLLPNTESFIISHGSWQNRWKLSVTPDRHIRWTVHSMSGAITDLDSEMSLSVDSTYHIAASYDGNYMLLYVDGVLNSFKPFGGAINSTDIGLEIAQMLPDDQTYNFRGVLDDIRIYDHGLHPDTVHILSGGTTTSISEASEPTILEIFPNPVTDDLYIFIESTAHPMKGIIYNQLGRVVRGPQNMTSGLQKITLSGLTPGIYFLEIQSAIETRTSTIIKHY